MPGIPEKKGIAMSSKIILLALPATTGMNTDATIRRVRIALSEAEAAISLLPDGRHKSLAITALEDALLRTGQAAAGVP